ncbi:hypothetical protein AGMMS49983_19830 [Clostridia bacterium]|nr:hypothetical protein AGMMS49983_19830 [Clostridia bacterium]
MKIRTLENLQDTIDAEMAWRKRELTAIKANIQSSRNFAKNTALRAGITLLYAHWEGSVKNIAYYYLCYVSHLRLPYNRLKHNFLAISIKSDLSRFTSSSKLTVQTKIVSDIFSRYNQSSQIPHEGIIRTNSNLNASLFTEILCTLGLDIDAYSADFTLIDEVLLNMRNKIAHGEQLEELSLDEERYNQIHAIMFRLIDQFAVQVLNAASSKEYLLGEFTMESYGK